MPFGFHWYDLLAIVLIGLLFLGPKRLPEMGSAIGKTIKEFQKSMHEVTAPKADESALSAPVALTSTPQLPASVAAQPIAQPLPNAAPTASAASVDHAND
jgi:sec-independent protein translocase protein TatA